jgi:nucleoside-diphosphate-sugar epimerase
MDVHDKIIGPEGPVLVTGASGFIGTRVVASLLEHGLRRVRCFTRPSSDLRALDKLRSRFGENAQIEVMKGNLLARGDCLKATDNIAVIYHLAIGGGGKSFPDSFLNAVVTTRNLLEASLHHRCLKRFVNLSSFAVYTNRQKPRGRPLDESCPTEEQAEVCGEAYCYAKVKQDGIVVEFAKKHGLSYVLVRPGTVYGPDKTEITGRVGLGTFGIFLHLGGANPIPLTYVDNCADAIVLAGLVSGVDGEVFNVVDDDLPSSREFLRLYKREVRRFNSVYLPRPVSYLLCYLWERYSAWSQGQLPEFLNRRAWHAYWKGSEYSNEKIKQRLGWTPRVPTHEGLARFFESCRQRGSHA